MWALERETERSVCVQDSNVGVEVSWFTIPVSRRESESLHRVNGEVLNGRKEDPIFLVYSTTLLLMDLNLPNFNTSLTNPLSVLMIGTKCRLCHLTDDLSIIILQMILPQSGSTAQVDSLRTTILDQYNNNNFECEKFLQKK